MRKLRSVVAVTGTAVAFAGGFVLLGRVIGFDSPWLALLLMFDLMGLAKVAEPIFVLRVPAAVHRIRPRERSEAVQQRLGVRRFGALLRDSPLRYLNANVYLASGVRDVEGLYRRTASAEATHFWAAVAFTAYIAYLLLAGRPGMAALFTAVQVLFNVYPILHLRSVRARLDELLRRRAPRRAASSTRRSAP